MNAYGIVLCETFIGESEIRSNDKRGSCKRNEAERTAVWFLCRSSEIPKVYPFSVYGRVQLYIAICIVSFVILTFIWFWDKNMKTDKFWQFFDSFPFQSLESNQIVAGNK